MKYTSIFFFLVLFWTACKKAELPSSSFEDPVFTVTYFPDTISSQTVTAGKDDRYLFTDFVTNDSFVCSGTFSEVDCPDGNCPGSLTFEFKSLATDPFAADTVFHLGGYQFLGPDTMGSVLYYLVTFNAIDSTLYNSFFWEIDGQNAGTGPNLVMDFPNISLTPKSIELKAQKASGLQSTIRRVVSLTDTTGNQFPGLNINALPDSSFFLIVAETTGPPYDMLMWDTGDTTPVLLQDTLSSSYSVISSDMSGNTAMAAFDGLTSNEIPLRTADFTYTVEQIIVPTPPGEVAIRWVDAQGIIWHSDKGSQDIDSNFIVAESESYDLNDKGQKTRKMQVTFNCRLFNDAGESRSFSGSGTIAVAHP